MYKVKCEICSNYFKGLAGHLKVKHNISTEEYKIKSKETSLKKWGVESYTKTEEYKEKRKKIQPKKLGL